jgi:hypothetical protein
MDCFVDFIGEYITRTKKFFEEMAKDTNEIILVSKDIDQKEIEESEKTIHKFFYNNLSQMKPFLEKIKLPDDEKKKKGNNLLLII